MRYESDPFFAPGGLAPGSGLAAASGAAASRLKSRSAEQVLYDHLALRDAQDLETDLARNYADNVVVLTKDGIHHGKAGIRRTAAVLQEALPDAAFSYDAVQVGGEVALLIWKGRAANGARTCDGVDSFVIRDGRIVSQTIHYTVEPR